MLRRSQLSYLLVGGMTFDGVELPFVDDEAASFSTSSSLTRQLALAREAVWAELRSSPEAMAAWEVTDLKSMESQTHNTEAFRSFLPEMHHQHPSHNVISSSPISGAVRVPAAHQLRSPLDLVTVADPPLSLRASSSQNEKSACRLNHLHQKGGSIGDSEVPLLASSSQVSLLSSVEEMPTWTPEQLASQSTLDGVFFEALLSQQLNLALWINCANPDEALRDMLQDVQMVDRRLCDEETMLLSLNAARYTEQRSYKRRRLEVQSQTLKSKAKVESLEKLLHVTPSNGSCAAASKADRLHLWLQE